MPDHGWSSPAPGTLVGVVAAVVAFGFAKIFGEPQVDRAIAFQEQMDHAKREPS
jgi:hypothetical protein